MKILLFKILLFILAMLFTTYAFAGGNVGYQNYTVTNGSTTAYQTLISSSAISALQAYACDTSGTQSKIAAGAAGSEVDLFTVPASACQVLNMNPYQPAGTRFSVKGLGVSNSSGATTGAVSLSLIP
jgi:hypothetical protein